MFTISEEFIRSLVSTMEVYRKGVRYYKNGAVTEAEYNPLANEVSSIVLGTQDYHTAIEFDDSGKELSFYCECQAFSTYDGACKHLVALLYYIKDHLNPDGQIKPISDNMAKPSEEESYQYQKEFIKDFRMERLKTIETKKEEIKVEVYLELLQPYGFNRGNRDYQIALFLKIGQQQLYVLKDYNEFFDRLDRKEPYEFGKNFTFDPMKHLFISPMDQLLGLIRELNQLDYMRNHPSYYTIGKLISGKYAYLSDSYIKKVFVLLEDKPFKIRIKGMKDVKGVIKQGIPLKFQVKEVGNEICLEAVDVDQLLVLTDDYEYVYYRDEVYHLDKDEIKIIHLIKKYASQLNGFTFSKEHKDVLVSEVLSHLKEYVIVDIDPAIEEKIVKADLRTVVHLDYGKEGLVVHANFQYDDIVINAFNDEKKEDEEGIILQRDIEKERRLLECFQPYMLYVADERDYVFIKDEEQAYDFLLITVPLLCQEVDVYYSDALRAKTFINNITVHNELKLNNSSNMLEYSFSIEGIDNEELYHILKQVKIKKKYYKAKNGSIINLNSEELLKVSHLIDSLEITKSHVDQGKIQLPMYRSSYIDTYLRDNGFLHVHRNRALKELISDLKEPEDMDYTAPMEVKDILRPYQFIGFKWLKTLSKYAFGGILADDMGLGKTLQTIAFILSEYGNWSRPSLVIAPTSLVLNWQDEVYKFAPDMRVTVISGDKKTREEAIKNIGKEHLVITSYALIRNDIDAFKDITFAYCIIDEAQYIKNPRALTTKAVKSIKSRGRFALTGTPIENSLVELWSIFDFIMPKYLYKHNQFMEKYERPIVKEKDLETLTNLNKQINPFVLRRLKEDVLKELPPKIEDMKSVELDKEQKKLYVAYLKEAKNELDHELQRKGFQQSQIKILSILTRLRQLCCHPSLFIDDYKGQSSKLELLKELLNEAVQGGHRVLIFSQFTSMLKIIREMIEQEGFSYYYLDGTTKVDKRREYVKNFNNNQKDIFLISLKAGGTGLNLVGADMVIHYDPWWNPAVEQQATDRAHRIGQKKTVQVIKLITKGTIEEKIFELQQKKKDLIQSVIQPGETFINKMTKEDVMNLFN